MWSIKYVTMTMMKKNKNFCCPGNDSVYKFYKKLKENAEEIIKLTLKVMKPLTAEELKS